MNVVKRMAIPDLCSSCACDNVEHPYYHVHVPIVGCTENYLSAKIRSLGCRPSESCKRVIITEYMGTDFQNDQFFTRVLDAIINMKVDPDYSFTYSGGGNITTFNVTLGTTDVLAVNIADQTATFNSTPIVFTLGSGTFIYSGDTYTIQLFPTYFTLTSAGSGLIFSSNTGTIEPV